MIALITTLLVFGIKESAGFNNIMVIIKVAVILLFIAIGFSFVQGVNWKPFIPENTGEWGHFGISGILRAAGVIFFAYIGFDAVSTAAQEAKNPQRDMPIGIFGSLSVSTILYILVAIVLTGIVSYTLLNVADPVAVGVNAMGEKMFWLRPIIKIAAIAGLSSVILVMLLGQPRIFYTMSRDGLLPPVFSKVHPKFQDTLCEYYSYGCSGHDPCRDTADQPSRRTCFYWYAPCLYHRLHKHHRSQEDKTRCSQAIQDPFVPVIPALGALICLAQMLALPLDTWLRLIGWMALGFVIYFTYGIHHSRIRKMNQKG